MEYAFSFRDCNKKEKIRDKSVKDIGHCKKNISKCGPLRIFVGFPISVNYEGKHLMDISVNVCTTISRLKTLIATRLGSNTKMISLKMVLTHLDDVGLVGTIGIKEGDQLTVVMNERILIADRTTDNVTDYIVREDQTIRDIKEELSKKGCISADRIMLSLAKKELKDAVTVASLKITDDTIMEMKVEGCSSNTRKEEVKDAVKVASLKVTDNTMAARTLHNNDAICGMAASEISLTVVNRLNYSLTNAHTRIIVDHDSTVQGIRNAISRQLLIGMYSVDVHYRGRVLADGSINNYGIVDGDTLTLRERKVGRNISEKFILNVTQAGEKGQQYLIDNFLTVRGLKEILRNEYNVGVNRIRLWMVDEELRDYDVIRDLDIDNGATVSLRIEGEVARGNGSGAIAIRVRNYLSTEEGGECHDVSLNYYRTVQSLRNRLETVFNLSSQDYVVSFNGKILKPTNLIIAYRIGDGDELVISHSLLIRYIVGWKDSYAHVQWYPFMPGDKGSDLKLKVMKRINIGPQLFNILYNGCILDDEKNFRQYGIRNEAHLMMVATVDDE